MIPQIKRNKWSVILLMWLSITYGECRRRVVCYYGDWSEDRSAAYRLLPGEIEPGLCTHVVYAFAMPDLKGGIVPMDFLVSLTDGGSDEFANLRKKNPDLKLMLSVGGWNEGSLRFSKLASDPVKRSWFAQYSCQFVRSIGFDGLDINWQWPGIREGSNSADKNNFSLFVKAVKRYYEQESVRTNKTRLLLSVVLPPFEAFTSQGFHIDTMIQEVDFLNVLTMEYHASTEPRVNHPAPLFTVHPSEPDYQLTVDGTVRMYLKLGVQASQMNLGIPLYGHSYLLENSVSTQLGSPAEDEGMEGFGTRTPGTLAYFEICRYIKDNGWTVEHPNRTALGPYAYLGNDWVAYDDVDIIKRKVRYANDKGLGGVMLWTIDLDDFKGTCDSRFPLTRAAREAVAEGDASEPATPLKVDVEQAVSRTETQPSTPNYLWSFDADRDLDDRDIKIPTFSGINNDSQLLSNRNSFPDYVPRPNNPTSNRPVPRPPYFFGEDQNDKVRFRQSDDTNSNVFRTHGNFHYKKSRFQFNRNTYYDN